MILVVGEVGIQFILYFSINLESEVDDRQFFLIDTAENHP